jgi:hypothetical protein
VEFQQEREQQTLVAPPQIKQGSLRGTQAVIVLALLDQARTAAVHVQAPSEVVLKELAERRLVAPEEEKQIRIVLGIEERGFGKKIQSGADSLY